MLAIHPKTQRMQALVPSPQRTKRESGVNPQTISSPPCIPLSLLLIRPPSQGRLPPKPLLKPRHRAKGNFGSFPVRLASAIRLRLRRLDSSRAMSLGLKKICRPLGYLVSGHHQESAKLWSKCRPAARERCRTSRIIRANQMPSLALSQRQNGKMSMRAYRAGYCH